MSTKSKARWRRFSWVVLLGAALDLGALVGSAQAIVGRPLTPMSYAGVARRTTRRTVAVGAAVTPGPYAAPYYYW